MEVVRRRNGDELTLTARAERIDGIGSRIRGLARLARRDDYGLVLSFESVGERRASTLLTPLALDVVWTESRQVTHVARLNRWTGIARGTGDRVFEFPAGLADDVRVGDEVVVR